MAKRRGCVALLDPPPVEDPTVWARGSLSIDETAELLGESTRSVRDRMWRGELVWGRLDGRTRIAQKSAEDVLDAGWRWVPVARLA